VLLPRDLIESLGSPLSRDNLVTHKDLGVRAVRIGAAGVKG